ncbi:hypothetical protein HYW21_05165 [Candidatus Woesearchaeota archaeon]|nr:hypothetical protein [Candidatus Woesearchaeota archaeon]
MLKRQEKNRAYVDSVVQPVHQKIAQIEALHEKLLVIDFPTADFKTVKETLTTLDEHNFAFWKLAFVCEFFDPNGDDLFDEYCKKEGCKLSQKERSTMLRYPQHNYVQEERFSMLTFAKECLGKKKSISGVTSAKAFLQNHAKKYFFIDNSWESTKILTTEDFEKRLQELILEKKEVIEEQIIDLTTDWTKKHQKIREKYTWSDDLDNIFYFFQELTYLRDHRKKAVLLLNHYYDQCIRRMEEITDIPYKEWRVCRAEDIAKGRTKKEYQQIIAKRQEIIMSIYSKNQIIRVLEEEAKEYYQLLSKSFENIGKNIKGTTACRGKATGIIRVVLGESHFGKFNEKDILVAHMTRPEYVPLMKKAAAIITDEGGITCHAAVIARELNVPCIIGTQIATKVLKDGMVVSVDADKGIIKITEQ